MKLVDCVEKLIYEYKGVYYVAHFRHGEILKHWGRTESGYPLVSETKTDYELMKMMERDYKARKKAERELL